ncbi:MAG: hypothetical protein ACP5NQ_06825, partial [Vulcanisaeta sp.]
MGATRFMSQLSEVIRPVRLALIAHVSSMIIMAITVTTTEVTRYPIIYVLLLASSVALVMAALTKLREALGKAKEFYLTRIRDAVWSQRAAPDVNRESEELCVMARLYVV